MSRKFPHALFALIITISLTGSLSATTYYIAANGSDSNSGTSKSSPWLHAPGINGCAALCGSTNPKAGDQIIFRGGDTWGTSNFNVWGLNWSGSSGSPIYIGVDQSWFSGSSWSR